MYKKQEIKDVEDFKKLVESFNKNRKILKNRMKDDNIDIFEQIETAEKKAKFML